MLRFRAVLTMGALVALTNINVSTADDGELKEIPKPRLLSMNLIPFSTEPGRLPPRRT